MNRSESLIEFRVAGYHSDPFPQWLYAESGIRMADAQRAMREGRAMRNKGVKCECVICKVEKLEASNA